VEKTGQGRYRTRKEVYVRLRPNDNCRKEWSSRNFRIEVMHQLRWVRNSYRRNRQYMIPFQSKTAVFDNLGDGKEPIESTITQRQDDDVRASEMQANLDTSSTKG
jgi:hypothetical protein